MTNEEIKQVVNKIKGWSSLEDMDVLIKHCQQLPENPVILEIGTGMGRSSLLMALIRPDAQIHTMDAFGMVGQIELHSKTGFMFNRDNVEYAEKIWKEFGVTNIILHIGDCHTLPWDKQTDLIFIDGDHRYDGIKADYERFYPFVKKGSYMLFHDANTRSGLCEVPQFFEDLLKNNPSLDYHVEANVGVLKV